MLQNAVAEFASATARDPLVVSLDPQFASRWLPPRLQRLLADPAGANVELHVEERLADFTTDGVDVAVRYGAGHWEAWRRSPCSPRPSIRSAVPRSPPPTPCAARTTCCAHR